jgi:hypothetical protein
MFEKLVSLLNRKKAKTESKNKEFKEVLATPKKALTIEDFDKAKAKKNKPVTYNF